MSLLRRDAQVAPGVDRSHVQGPRAVSRVRGRGERARLPDGALMPRQPGRLFPVHGTIRVTPETRRALTRLARKRRVAVAAVLRAGLDDVYMMRVVLARVSTARRKTPEPMRGAVHVGYSLTAESAEYLGILGTPSEILRALAVRLAEDAPPTRTTTRSRR